MTDRFRITVDRGACDGTGLCAGTAPEHFELDGDGKGRARLPVVAASEDVVLAAECCPMEAIRVVDAATGRLVAPPGEGEAA